MIMYPTYCKRIRSWLRKLGQWHELKMTAKIVDLEKSSLGTPNWAPFLTLGLKFLSKVKKFKFSDTPFLAFNFMGLVANG